MVLQGDPCVVRESHDFSDGCGVKEQRLWCYKVKVPVFQGSVCNVTCTFATIAITSGSSLNLSYLTGHVTLLCVVNGI
jgi:hypothetical protein